MHPFGTKAQQLLQAGDEEGEDEMRLALNADRKGRTRFEWAREIKNRYAEATSSGTLVELPDEVQLYIDALIKHTRASPSMIRYGAGLCLLATISIYGPVVLDRVPSVMNAIISGCLDSYHLASSLYLKLMNVVAQLKGCKQVEEMTCARLDRFCFSCSKATPSTHVYIRESDRSGYNVSGQDLECMLTPSRYAVARAAMAMSPGLDSAYLLSLSASLPFMKRSSKISQMRLIEVWLGRGGLSKVAKPYGMSGDFVQNMLPHLQSPDEDIRKRAVAIFQHMAPQMREVGH